MLSTLRWLVEAVPHARTTPPARDGAFALVTRRADGAFAPTFGALPEEQAASLRAELGVPDGWILETLYYDLGPTDEKLEGYRVAIHGVRVLSIAIGETSQSYTLSSSS